MLDLRVEGSRANKLCLEPIKLILLGEKSSQAIGLRIGLRPTPPVSNEKEWLLRAISI